MTMPPARQYDLISVAPSRHRHRQHPSTTAGTTEADKARASHTSPFHQRENNGRPVGRRRVGGYAAHAFNASLLDQKKTTAWAVVSNPAARMRPSGTVLPRGMTILSKTAPQCGRQRPPSGIDRQACQPIHCSVGHRFTIAAHRQVSRTKCLAQFGDGAVVRRPDGAFSH